VLYSKPKPMMRKGPIPRQLMGESVVALWNSGLRDE
jgi:hypothetical protein